MQLPLTALYCSAESRARMCVAMNVLKTLHTEVSIDLGGGQGNVTEKFLHGTQVSACFEQVCREGVAHRMR